MSTKVRIDPGVCGFICNVEAITEDGMNCKLVIHSGCEPIAHLTKANGDTFNAYDICLAKPGKGAIYEYASEHFPSHCCCPVPAGIIKAMEAECQLALKKDASIVFRD